MPELTAGAIEREFGLKRHSLYQYENDGSLNPRRTPGGQRRYDRAEIETLLGVGTPPTAKQERFAYKEFGVTGLRHYSGKVYEERLQEMRGRPGRIKKREMRVNDPVLAAVFFGIGHALRQATSRVAPASESDADKECAEFVDSCLKDMSFSLDDQKTFIIEPMLEQGFSYLEIVFKKRLGQNPPDYLNDPDQQPAPSQHNDGRVGWRKWAPRPADSLREGSEWIFDRGGGVRGAVQQAYYGPDNDPHPIPIQKALLFRTTVHPANNPEGLAIHRPAYIPYFYTEMLQEIEGIGVERNVSGLPVGYLGSDRTFDGANSDFEMMKDLVVNVRNDEQMGLVFPGPKMGSDGKGFLFELVSPTGRLQWDISGIIERYDKRKALVVLAQFILLGMQQVGSYALSKHQGDLFTLAIEAWLKSIADIINRHAIPQLLSFNVFPDITGPPRLIFDSVGVPDLLGISQYINAMVEREVLTPDDELERHVRLVAGLPEKPIKDEATTQAEQAGIDRDLLDKNRNQLEDSAMLLRRLTLAIEPLQQIQIMDQEESAGILRPLIDDLKTMLVASGLSPEFEKTVELAKGELYDAALAGGDLLSAGQNYVTKILAGTGESTEVLCPYCAHKESNLVGDKAVCKSCRNVYDPSFHYGDQWQR